MELSKESSKKEVIESLRKSNVEDAQFNIFGVTPEFQRYISKQLSEILDRKLKKITEFAICNEKPIENPTEGGIKLFSNSENFLETVEYHSNHSRKFSQKKYFDRLSVNEKNLAGIAVSGEAILQKHDLKYWSKRTKGKVFCYKKVKNGQLMLQE